MPQSTPDRARWPPELLEERRRRRTHLGLGTPWVWVWRTDVRQSAFPDAETSPASVRPLDRPTPGRPLRVRVVLRRRADRFTHHDGLRHDRRSPRVSRVRGTHTAGLRGGLYALRRP